MGKITNFKNITSDITMLEITKDDDFDTVLLKTLNLVEMVTISLLILPIFDVITLSKYISQFRYQLSKWRLLSATLIFIYVMLVGIFGIVNPSKTLNKLKIYKLVRQNETTSEKLRRIIDASNATRNYLLGAFSMFYVLVIWRLLEYIKFSAKLHEFSNLMGTYNLVDVTFDQDETIDMTEKLNMNFDDTEALSDSVPLHAANSELWPSVTDLSHSEKGRIQSFLKNIPAPNEKKTAKRSIIDVLRFRKSKVSVPETDKNETNHIDPKSSESATSSIFPVDSNLRLLHKPPTEDQGNKEAKSDNTNTDNKTEKIKPKENNP